MQEITAPTEEEPSPADISAPCEEAPQAPSKEAPQAPSEEVPQAPSEEVPQALSEEAPQVVTPPDSVSLSISKGIISLQCPSIRTENVISAAIIKCTVSHKIHQINSKY